MENLILGGFFNFSKQFDFFFWIPGSMLFLRRFGALDPCPYFVLDPWILGLKMCLDSCGSLKKNTGRSTLRSGETENAKCRPEMHFFFTPVPTPLT